MKSTRFRHPLAGLLALYFRLLHAAIAHVLPGMLQRALRRRFAGIWSHHEGTVPEGGAVVAANHHSWWDLHLAIAMCAYHRRPSAGVMDDAQLANFPFFRHLGVIGASQVRQAVRYAQAGHHLVVCVEGAIQPPGRLAPVQPGAAAIARWAGVPILPCAIRVVMRGMERPEIYLRFGAPLPVGSSSNEVAQALAPLLDRLDADIAAAPNAEVAVPGYRAWWPAKPTELSQIRRWRRFWGAA